MTLNLQSQVLVSCLKRCLQSGGLCYFGHLQSKQDEAHKCLDFAAYAVPKIVKFRNAFWLIH